MDELTSSSNRTMACFFLLIRSVKYFDNNLQAIFELRFRFNSSGSIAFESNSD